jgi:hypothetical protein
MLQARAALLQAREFGVIAMAVEQVFEATDKMDLRGRFKIRRGLKSMA